MKKAILPIAVAGLLSIFQSHAAEIVNTSFETSEGWPTGIAVNATATDTQASVTYAGLNIADNSTSPTTTLTGVIDETNGGGSNFGNHGTQSMWLRNVGASIIINPTDNNGISTISWSDKKWTSGDGPMYMKVYKKVGTNAPVEITNADVASGGSYNATNGFTIDTSAAYRTINIDESGDVAIIFTNNNGDASPSLKGIFIDEVIINDYSTQSYSGSTCTQANELLKAGETDKKLIKLQVTVDGAESAYSLTALDLGLTGNASLDNIKVYYTGTTNSFDTTTLLHTEASPASTVNITGLTQALLHGDNYFWIAVDVNSSTTLGTVIDASCSQITIDNGTPSNQTPSTQAPAGYTFVTDRSNIELYGTTAHHITIPASAVYNKAANGGFTVEFWVKTTDSNGTIFSNYDENSTGSTGGFEIGVIGGNIKSRIVTANNSQGAIQSSAIVNDGAWHHVAVVIDPVAGQLVNYVDGVKQSQIWTSAGVMNEAMVSDHDIKIGVEAASSDTYMRLGSLDGSVAEVRIWNVSRSETEVNDNMYTHFQTVPASLVGYWKINEGTGTTINKLSATGADGVLTGGAWVGSNLPAMTTLSGLLATDNLISSATVINKGETSTTTSGMELADTSSNLDISEHVTFVNTSDSVSTTTSNVTPANTYRTSRAWYIAPSSAGSKQLDIVFKLDDIDPSYISGSDKTQYSLLYRTKTEGSFNTLIATADTIESASNKITFNNVSLAEGYYSLGSLINFTPVYGLVYEQSDSQLSWQVDYEGDIAEYRVEVKSSDSDWSAYTTVQPDGTKSYSIAIGTDKQYRIVAVDNSGYQQSFYVENTSNDLVIDIKEGWNLLSVNMQVNDWTEFFEQSNSTLWGWQKNKYVNLDSPDAFDGFWFYSTKDLQITLQGQKPADKSRYLNKGWNLMGPGSEMKKPQSVLIYQWDESYLQLNETSSMIPGKGYWIYSDADQPILLP